jgi:hypothetical protein
MKKFSEFKNSRKINEAEENKENDETTNSNLTNDNQTSFGQPMPQTQTNQFVPQSTVTIQTATTQPTTEQPTQQEQIPNTQDTVKDDKKEQENNTCTVQKLFSKLFESREMAHIYHLQVKDKGLAEHLALGNYYEEVIDLIDKLVEVYSGQYDIVKDYDVIDTSDTETKDKITYFKEVAEYIMKNKYIIPEKDTHIHSIIDDIMCLLCQTLYKLKFL